MMRRRGLLLEKMTVSERQVGEPLLLGGSLLLGGGLLLGSSLLLGCHLRLRHDEDKMDLMRENFTLTEPMP